MKWIKKWKNIKKYYYTPLLPPWALSWGYHIVPEGVSSWSIAAPRTLLPFSVFHGFLLLLQQVLQPLGWDNFFSLAVHAVAQPGVVAVAVFVEVSMPWLNNYDGYPRNFRPLYSGDPDAPLAGVPPRNSMAAAANIWQWQGGNTAAAAW